MNNEPAATKATSGRQHFFQRHCLRSTDGRRGSAKVADSLYRRYSLARDIDDFLRFKSLAISLQKSGMHDQARTWAKEARDAWQKIKPWLLTGKLA